MQLLLAEDDEVLADALVEQLTRAGYRVKHALNGPVAEYLLTEHAFDVAILDIGLPMMDGLTVMKKARQVDPDLPVVILTALDQLDNRIAGLRAGADDYITKPFSFAELELRLQALLRRAKQSTVSTEVRTGGVTVDPTTRRAQVDGKAVELTPRETILLDLFLTHQGKVVTKEQIASAWSSAGTEPGIGNVAEMHVHRLRRKLEGSQLSIRTVRGLGYMLETEQPG